MLTKHVVDHLWVKGYLRETLHGTNKKNYVFNEVRDSHPELPKIICVLWDSLLLGKNNFILKVRINYAVLTFTLVTYRTEFTFRTNTSIKQTEL